MDIDPDVMRMDWLERHDPERAVVAASGILDQVQAGTLDPVVHFDSVELAAGIAADGPGGSPGRSMVCMRDIQPVFRHAERHARQGSAERLYLRGRPWIAYAESQNRVLGHARPAFRTSLALLTWLASIAGGWKPLAEIMGRPKSSVLADLTVAALAIYPATARRGLAQREDLLERYLLLALPLVEAYVAAGRDVVLYPRTAALAIQWMFALIRMGRFEDAALIARLYDLDKATRPDHARGQVTVPLREWEHARFRKDRSVAAMRLPKAARASMSAFPMPRHLEFVEVHGYLAA